MKWITATKRISLALLGTTALAVAAVPYLSDSALAGGDAGDSDETTISVRTSTDGKPTVIRVPNLKLGESQSYTSDSGKAIVITRSAEGLRLKVGEKETLIADHPGDDGASIVVHGKGDGGERKIIVMNHGDGDGGEGLSGKQTKVFVSGGAHGYSFRTGSGDGELRSSADLLKGRSLKTLDALDARTRQAVFATLDELMSQGVVIAPMADVELPGENGVQIQVERKRTRN